MSDAQIADFMSMITPDVTNQLLERSNYTELSNKQMTRLLNLNEHEIKFVDMFWNKVCNNDWILVTRELITTYLSDEQGEHVLRNFVNRRLIKNEHLNMGDDYMEVESNHILVIRYKQSRSDLSGEPANKKYYIITINTFKCLLMKSNTKNSHSYRGYMLKLEQLVMIASNYNAKLMEHKHLQSQRVVLQLTNEVEKYPAIHHLENERKVISDMARACNALNPAVYKDLIVLYVVALNETVTITLPDGTKVECPLNKLGYSDRNWDERMEEHEREHKNCKLAYIQCVNNGLMAERELKRRLKELGLRYKIRTRENGNLHNEIFYTTPEYNMTYVMNEIHHICLPRQSITMKDKQISDLSTKIDYLKIQLKEARNENKKLVHKCEKSNNEMIEAKINAASSSSKYDELNKLHQETRVELENVRAQLAQKSKECAVEKTKTKAYNNVRNMIIKAVNNKATASQNNNDDDELDKSIGSNIQTHQIVCRKLDDTDYEHISNSEMMDDNAYDCLCKKETCIRLTDEERYPVIKRFIHNSVKPDKWSPEIVKLMCAKNFCALHACKTAMTMIHREDDGTLVEHIEGGRREHTESLNRAHVRGQEDGNTDECMIQLIHKKDDFLRMQIARDLILAAGFSGCNDARHIELNLESMRKYMIDNESSIKSIWPRSNMKNLDDSRVLLMHVNNKLKECGFQLIRNSKKKTSSCALQLINQNLLNEHGIVV